MAKVSRFPEPKWDRQELPLDTIRIDPILQLRAVPLDEKLVSEYASKMREGATFPPIQLAKFKRKHVILDGFHRHAAALKAGLRTIAAQVAEMSKEEAQAHAFRVNTTHGKKLTPGDKRRKVQEYIERGLHLRADGSVKSAYLVSEELGGIPTARAIYNYFPRFGVTPGHDHYEDGVDVEPWTRRDMPSDDEATRNDRALVEEAEQTLLSLRKTCENMEGLDALFGVSIQVSLFQEWLGQQLGDYRGLDI